MLERTLSRIALSTLILTAVISLAKAQDFSFTCEDSIQPGVAMVENYFEAILTNTSAEEKSFVVDLDTTGIGDWNYFWCTEAMCFPPWVFSVTFSLSAGADTTIQVHITPDEPPFNQGGVALTAYLEQYPSDSITIEILVYFGTAVENEAANNQPENLILSAYPNPFNPETTISYTLDHAKTINISIYDPLGQKVRNLFQGFQSPGTHLLFWNGQDERGVELPTGLYFITFNNGRTLHTVKTLKLK